jgi:hypothetical protein
MTTDGVDTPAPGAVGGRGPRSLVALLAVVALVVGVALGATWVRGRAAPAGSRIPERLADTGLYADFSSATISPQNRSYEPQYPLWTDGAAKRRWVYLPPGKAIDASDPDHWRFPAGTKFWKEFSFGRAVETRFMEQTEDGEWIFASYVWNENGSDAVLAPEKGVKGVCEIRPGVRHDIPGRYDCLACHEGQPGRVLGFSALQLSADRDPLAPHAVTPASDAIDLDELLARELLASFPSRLDRAPRIDAPTPRARAALGYLNANCGHCHSPIRPIAGVDLTLETCLVGGGAGGRQVLGTCLAQRSRFQMPGEAESASGIRIVPGDPAHSVLLERMASRIGSVQMPPLGTHLVDDEAVALLTAWIRDDLPAQGVETTSRNPTQSEEKP